MAFAHVSWEVSTGDPGQAVTISQAVQLAIAPFRPCMLLSDSVLFDTDDFSIDAIRRALDGVALQFPTEFYYHSGEVGSGSGFMQGVYPRMAELARARNISGNQNSPFQRLGAAVGGGPVGAAPGPVGAAPGRAPRAAARRRKRAAGSKKRGARKRAAGARRGRSGPK